MKKTIMSLLAIGFAIILMGCAEGTEGMITVDGEEKEKVVLKERVPVTDWKSKVGLIALSDDTREEKIDNTLQVFNAYTASEEEVQVFFLNIVKGFTSGDYINNRSNDEYMLNGLFMSNIVFSSLYGIESDDSPYLIFADNVRSLIEELYIYQDPENMDEEYIMSIAQEMEDALQVITELENQ